MATIFKNPRLEDYFVERGCDTPLITEYEAGKVILLPDAKFEIDHEFWASLPVDHYPGLKKTFAAADGGVTLANSLARSKVPADLSARILEESEKVLGQALPIYERLFEGYRFTRRKVSWRLNVTMNENIHVDLYKEPVESHLARMFINLDTQPRIWNTSYTLDQMYSMVGQDSLAAIGADADPDQLHTEVGLRTFGLRSSKEWWDNKDRHIIFFDPGDCWLVDSRLVSHQVMYGRRALSIDFLVETDSMGDPGRQYMSIAQRFIDSQLLAGAE